MAIYILPRDALIYMDNNKIEIDIPEKIIKKIRMKNIHDAKGVLKNRKIDPVLYQQTVREEWS